MLVCGIQSLPGHFSIQTWDAVGGGGGDMWPTDARAFSPPTHVREWKSALGARWLPGIYKESPQMAF